MKKERFDLVFGLGAACSCSRILRERRLQYASFPLDWVGDPRLDAREDLALTTATVVNGFSNWFEKENLVRATEYDSPKHIGLFDRETRLYFAHDIEQGEDLHVRYSEVRAKYERRIARLLKLLGSAGKVLIVWIADPRGCGEVGESDMKRCLEAFRKGYPGVEFRLLAANCVPGLDPEKMRILRGDGYECYSFDYRVVKTGEPTWDVRTELFGPIFDRFEVVDYRTAAEKRANAKRERARDMERFRATSALDLLVTKAKFKVYRHLKRGLERKGVRLEGL